MAKKIRFPLEMKNGVEVRDIEELKENFSLEQVLFYLSDGKLETWLRDRYLDDIADAVLALNQEDADFHKKICGIFEVEYVEEREEDMEKAMERKRKTALLKEFTDGEKFYGVVDQIAFEQDDLYDLLDEGETTIYLCGEKFSVPLGKRGMKYIGINHPVVVISSKEKVDFEEKGITFENIKFDEKYQKILDAHKQEKVGGDGCDKVPENETIQALSVAKENMRDSHAEANRLLEVLKYDTRPDSLNMNIVKFEALVKKIRSRIGGPNAFEIMGNIRDGGDAPVGAVIPMGMIFNYDDLNEYGKIIMEPEYPGYIKRKGTDGYYYSSDFLRPLGADEKRYAAVKFVEYCKGKETAYEFIFWSLLILTVDDTDKEEHLAMIFDFAEMLEISEQEVLNILQIVRMVYTKEEEEYDFDPMIISFEYLLLDVGKRKKRKNTRKSFFSFL